MLIGVPREIKTHEYRVGAHPPAQCANTWHTGIMCWSRPVRAQASALETMPIVRPERASLRTQRRKVFARAAMIIKVKEPQPSEWVRLHEERFSSLDPASRP